MKHHHSSPSILSLVTLLLLLSSTIYCIGIFDQRASTYGTVPPRAAKLLIIGYSPIGALARVYPPIRNHFIINCYHAVCPINQSKKARLRAAAS